MPRNASGTVTLPTNDSNPAAPRNVIRSSDFNELMTDITTELTDSWSRSGKGAALADLDMGGFSLLNPGNLPTNARAVNTGTGLTGGGDLSADRTIALNAASIASLLLADSSLQPADLSSSAVIGKGMKPKDFTGLVTIDIPNKLFLFHGEGFTGGQDVHSFRVDRRADYVGGVAGFENAAIVINNIVSASSTLSYEDALLAIMDNSSPGPSQNTAARFVGRKRSTGSTWSLANEITDLTGTADPASGLVGVEQVVGANGTDANNNRVGFDAIIARPQTGGVFSGAAAEGGVAFRATNQVADAAANRWKKGFEATSVGASTGYSIAFDATTATIMAGGAAFAMKGDDKFSFTQNLDRTMRYSTGAIRFNNNSVDHFIVLDNGDTDQFGVVKISGTQVVTSRETGYTAGTGTPNKGAFAADTATAVQAAQRVLALEQSMRRHGLID